MLTLLDYVNCFIWERLWLSVGFRMNSYVVYLNTCAYLVVRSMHVILARNNAHLEQVSLWTGIKNLYFSFRKLHNNFNTCMVENI